MAQAFERRYTDEQRDALAYAYEDEKVRPARRVVELAAAGALTFRGEQLAPFQTNANTVRDEARKLRRRRAGDETSELASLPPRDAIEALRQRLVNAADSMLASFERTVKREPGKADPERLRQIARAVREAAALPGPNDQRPRAPGSKHGGKRTEGETKGGLAGAILAAHRSSADGAPAKPAHERLNTQSRPQPTSHATHATPTTSHTPDDEPADGPGALVRERAERLGVRLD